MGLTLAAFADTATFLLMGTASEVMTVPRTAPLVAILLKAGLVLVLLAWPWRYGRGLRSFATVAWTIGALSNVLVLLS